MKNILKGLVEGERLQARNKHAKAGRGAWQWPGSRLLKPPGHKGRRSKLQLSEEDKFGLNLPELRRSKLQLLRSNPTARSKIYEQVNHEIWLQYNALFPSYHT